MINYFNFRKFEDEYLITNDLGSYMFIEESDFKKLAFDKITSENSRYDEFCCKGFVYNCNKDVFLEKFKEYMSVSKNYLFSSTSLHIFVVTNMCNVKCVYCQAQSSAGHNKGLMTEDTARKAIDIALSSKSECMTFEFQGGEPLINYKIIKFIVEYTEQNRGGKKVEYNLVSNLTLLNGEMLDFFKQYNVRISTSIDGSKDIHDKNRPYAKGGGTYSGVISQLKRVQEVGLSSGAIQTTTRYSLEGYRDIIDNYISLGMSSVFLRPLTPLGFAYDSWEKIGYSVDEFIEFYKNSIEYLLDINRKGICFSEGHASIFLHKILERAPVNYMELRSPCGAGIGQLAYYYDGQIFTCDEGRMLYEMGDASFKLGTVENTYNEIIDNPVCRAVSCASVLESSPQCCDCVYQPFCGTCPILNLAFEHTIFQSVPNDYKCSIYKGMLDVLFGIIKRNNEEEINILKSWIQ